MPDEILFVVDTTALQFAIMAYINGDAGVRAGHRCSAAPGATITIGASNPKRYSGPFLNSRFALLQY